MAYQPVTLRELRVSFGIDVNAHNDANCPFCGGKKRKTLHFDDASDTWRCSKCHAHGGVLAFFARYQMGIEEFPTDADKRRVIKEEMYKFLGYDNPDVPRPAFAKIPQKPVKKAASDDQLHAVYSAMASLALFHLLPEHKKDLKRRGLTSAQIERNGYRSFPFRAHIPQGIIDRYYSVDPGLREKHTAKKAAQIQLGLLVASMLEEKGYNLDGIPGFYKFGNYWCLLYNPGMLIPTRNIHGQIVLWQVRTNIEPKYRTLSCRDFPEAVNEGISRCHFPLANNEITPEIRVIFTEGPLKADIAKALTNDPCAFIAIPGIGNTKDLLENCKVFPHRNITTIYNALDMDKLTNPNVREGSIKLTQDIRDLGLQVIPMYWGEKHASLQLMFYKSLAKNRNIPVPPSSYQLSVCEKLNIVADALNKAGIDPGRITEHSEYWEAETKGIDDYLRSQMVRKEHSHRERANHMHTYHETLLRINEHSSP